MTSEHGEILRLWEKLRTEEEEDGGARGTTAKTTAEKKATKYEYKYPTIDALFKLIVPQFSTYVKTPKVSRVIQAIIKYGSPAHLLRLLKLLSSDLVSFSSDAYAHFVVTALARHAFHDLFKRLVALLLPLVHQLVEHKFGAEVIHAVYSAKWCSASERDLLLMAIYKDSGAVMKRWKGYPILEDVLRLETQHRKRLLSRLYELVDKLITRKDAIRFTFVQRLVSTFSSTGTKEEVTELCDTIRTHLVELCQTKEGAPLASRAFAILEPHKRKEALRLLSQNILDISRNKYGAPVVARLFDLVYDAQLLRKFVAAPLEGHMEDVINCPYGHQIILHLLTPTTGRKERCLLPHFLRHNLFSLGNEDWNRHTWLTHEYVPETVEICSKNAMLTHLAVLPSLLRTFIKTITTLARDEARQLNKHHVAILAREILHVSATEARYKKALALTTEEVAYLHSVAPASGGKTLVTAEPQVVPAASPKRKTERTSSKRLAGNRSEKGRGEKRSKKEMAHM